MKIAPVMRKLKKHADTFIPRIVHTGQQDSGMSDAFFEELGIAEADYHLGVGSSSHDGQTARIIVAKKLCVAVAP